MRLIHQDTSTGLLKLRIETASDLWRIARLVQPGERVGASTTRRDPEAPEDAPAAHRERRRVWLVVRAEQIEFHEFSRHVRVTGPIVEGPFDVGRHHTLDLVEGEEVSVQKESLSAVDRALLEEGLHARGEPLLVLAAVDWGQSTIVRLQGRTIVPVADLNRTIAGKRYAGTQPERDRSAYVEELLALLRKEAGDAVSLVIAGPGFLKEEIAKQLLEKDPLLKKKLRVYASAESGRAGVDELLRSGRAAEALQGSVAAEEADLIERLVTALGGGRRAAVGVREVGEALDGGAVETLVVLEDLLREPEVAPLLDRARAGRARVFIVRGGGTGGKRLEALGRIGALLRFDWTSPTGPRGPGAAR